MTLNLAKFGTAGLVLFFIVLLVFECFSVIVGEWIASSLGLTGFVWWIIVAGVVIVMNAVFVEVN